jgi:hypothetical protein
VTSGRGFPQLLLPKWLALHVFAVAASITMTWLGHWQWTAAHRHHGDIQNYAYAFQWWAFVGFTWLMWGRLIRDRAGGKAALAAEAAPPVVEAPSRYLGYQPPAATPVETDSERVRFNAYLAQLHATAGAPASAATSTPTSATAGVPAESEQGETR